MTTALAVLAVGAALGWRRRSRRRGVLGRLAAAEAPAPAAMRADRSKPHRSPDDAAVATFPDAVDLLAVAADAGLPPVVAVGAVALRAPPPWDDALIAVAGRVERGSLFAAALAELPARCGDPGRRLASVLRAAAEGAELAVALDRLASDARDLRRRRAEHAARRVPVRLLAPLVLCALPAFVLLALVPLVAGAFEALHP
jgi:Flp pilus assembly protein TadB